MNYKNLNLKRLFFVYFVLVVSIFLTGCWTNPVEKQKKIDAQIHAAGKLTDKKSQEIEDKGKSFVWGAGYAINQETNETPAIYATGRLIEAAKLTLGNPSVKDSTLMREIVDDLLAETKMKLALANASAALSKIERNNFEKEALKYKNQVEAGDRKLKNLESTIAILQGQESVLKDNYDKKLDETMKLAGENAEKAAKYDESQKWSLSNLNPFKDIFSGIKKLIGWGIFGVVLFFSFSILEIVFPQLKIFSLIVGNFGKLIMKFFPSAKNAAGLVSSKVWDGFKNLVVGVQHFTEGLKQKPIEEEVLKFIPDDAKLSKPDVKLLLQQHTENILKLIESELKEHNDADSSALVNYAKSETNLKPVAKNVTV